MKVELVLRKNLVRDYFALTKPKVVLLHMVTTAVAMFLAAKGLPSLPVLAATLSGGFLVAGASNVFNCYFDRDIDRMMARTRHRPLPSGLINPDQACIFGALLGLTGVFILARFVGIFVAALSIAAFIYYVVIYTLWLKRHTVWSTVLGSGAGAFPPLIGWVAVTGGIELTPILLFAIIALWSPPHFWSLAIYRSQDYKTVGLEVIPAGKTRRLIVVFAVLLIAVSLILGRTAGMGWLYLTSAALLGTAFLALAIRLRFGKPLLIARYLYLYSMFYLLILFVTMLVDRLV